MRRTATSWLDPFLQTWRKCRFAANQTKRLTANYQRNLMVLTHVPTMALIWVTKLFSSVPMKKPLVQ
jgi:hypothetical protein